MIPTPNMLKRKKVIDISQSVAVNDEDTRIRIHGVEYLVLGVATGQDKTITIDLQEVTTYRDKRGI